MSMHETTTASLPGVGLDVRKMPGHWVLARLGKRVLRPGGIELTRRLLAELGIGPETDVVEFAPGMGVTARLTLAHGPRSYQSIERDAHAAEYVMRRLNAPNVRCRAGSADDTGLPSASADVVYGEAMLSMQTPLQKSRIVAEAARLLRPGGRYGIHELCMHPEELPAETQAAIRKEMSEAVHVGVRPLTVSDWHALFAQHGLTVRVTERTPFHLLEPRRLVQDEGLGGALRFAWNAACDGPARARALAMRRVFRRHQAHLAAVMLVAEKRD